MTIIEYNKMLETDWKAAFEEAVTLFVQKGGLIDNLQLQEVRAELISRHTHCVDTKKESITAEELSESSYACNKADYMFNLTYVSDEKRNRLEESQKQMCTVDEEKVIKAVVEEALHRKMMFTSVDIANDIKLSGKWIRNHEVASYLRQNVVSICWDLGVSYTTTLIPVTLENGDTTQAYLYHPVDTDADDYKDTNQRALDPITANHPKSAALHIQSIPPVMSNPTIDTTDSTFDMTPWRVSRA